MVRKFVSLDLEKEVIAGIIRHKNVIPEISLFIGQSDFSSQLLSNTYVLAVEMYEKNKEISPITLNNAIKNLGISWKDKIDDIFTFYKGLSHKITISFDGTIESAKNLKKLTIKNEIYSKLLEAQKYLETSGSQEYSEIIDNVDSIINEQIKKYEREGEYENIFDDAEEKLENIEVKETVGYSGPWPLVDSIYGSLLRPSNITLVGARSGTGKSNISMFYTMYAAQKYDIPVLHLDAGEMTKNELLFRAISMLTKGEVNPWLLETGRWRKNVEIAKKVRSIWPVVKNIRYDYRDISGMSSREILSLVRRYSYSKVGRDNPFIINYDYIKPLDTSDFNRPEWKEMGHFIQDFKSFITNEIPVPLWTSVQLNRAAIIGNKKQQDMDFSESTITISDRITHQVSYAFILSEKTNDRMAEERKRYGNYILHPTGKKRHLGERALDVILPVTMPDNTQRDNYFNLECYGFYYHFKGDLRSQVEAMALQVDISDEDDGMII